MPSDTTGFRSLVEQIQLRDKETASPRETSPRETGRPRPQRTATAAADIGSKAPSASSERPRLLARRWL